MEIKELTQGNYEAFKRYCDAEIFEETEGKEGYVRWGLLKKGIPSGVLIGKKEVSVYMIIYIKCNKTTCLEGYGWFYRLWLEYAKACGAKKVEYYDLVNEGDKEKFDRRPKAFAYIARMNGYKNPVRTSRIFCIEGKTLKKVDAERFGHWKEKKRTLPFWETTEGQRRVLRQKIGTKIPEFLDPEEVENPIFDLSFALLDETGEIEGFSICSGEKGNITLSAFYLPENRSGDIGCLLYELYHAYQLFYNGDEFIHISAVNKASQTIVEKLFHGSIVSVTSEYYTYADCTEER